MTLHTIELYWRVGGARRFGVLLEDRLVLPYLEPSALGFATPAAHAFPVEVSDGSLDLRFMRDLDNPQIAALEVERE